MNCPNEFSQYTLSCPVNDISQEFFTINTAPNWGFDNYYQFNCPSESSNHYKNAKKILHSYLNDLHWIQTLKLPEELLRYVSKLKNKKYPLANLKDKTSSHQPIYIKDNYGTINMAKRQNINNHYQANDLATSNTLTTPSRRDDNEEVEEKNSFNSKWKTFLLKAETDESIHKYSPARHGIICSGDNVSGSPHYPTDIYNEYRKKKKGTQQIYSMDQEVCPYIDQVIDSDCLQEFKKNITNTPDTEDTTIASQVLFLEEIFAASLKLYKINVPLNHNEAIFNNYFVEPNLKAVCNSIDHSKYNWAKLGFFDGEEELLSMTKQLKRKGTFVDHRYIYKADGVVRLQEAHDIEICVVEVSNEYLNQDNRKIYFDHHKANYGCLAMLKTIADQYKYASVDVFEQLKIYFVHAADNKIKLWSLSYQDEVFHFWREGVLNIEPKFEDKETYQQDIITFYWTFKCKLEESLDAVKKIQDSHKINRKNSRYNSGENPKLLSQIINPNIIKLTENDHKKGMADLGPFDSPEHD